MRRVPVLCVILLILISVNANVAPQSSYNYNEWREAVAAPEAYRFDFEITGGSIGISEFVRPLDACAGGGYIAIANSGANNIIMLNSDFTLSRVIGGFAAPDSVTGTFNNPSGVCLDESGRLFIADTGNRRIIVLKPDDSLSMIIENPELTGISASYLFTPTKLTYSELTGELYVVSQEMYDGILTFDNSGSFFGFIGAPRVSVSLADLFWRRIASDEQRAKLNLFLPTKYSNVCADASGYIYATVDVAVDDQASAQNKIRKLNPSGRDLMIREGIVPINGDFGGKPHSKFTDITARSDGMFSAVDTARGRVFTYDDRGNLLYIFGGTGNTLGSLRSPAAIISIGDKLAVIDSLACKLIVYSPTSYAMAIHESISHERAGRYDEAYDAFSRVLAMNMNLDFAYRSQSAIKYYEADYAEAMRLALLGGDRAGYSKAYSKLRRDQLVVGFGAGVIVVAALLLAIKLTAVYNRRRVASGYMPIALKSLRAISPATDRVCYAGYVMCHPFDGFWDLKHEKRGSSWAATFWLVSACVGYVVITELTGFILNPRNPDDYNVVIEALSLLIPVILWVVVNWALTTLVGGEGSLKDVYIATCYALAPFALIAIPATLLSRVLVAEEAVIYQLILYISVVWSLGLVFFGELVTHDFSLPKALLTVIGTIAGAGIVIYILLLFFTFFDQLVTFITEIARELRFRN